MASKCSVSVYLYFANSLLLFVIVTGCEISTSPTPNSNIDSYPVKPNTNPYFKPNPNNNNPNLIPIPTPTTTSYPTPTPTPTPYPNSTPNSVPIPNSNGNPNQNPTSATCPRDTLRLGVCAELLGGLVSLEVGSPPVKPCCSLIQGLVDLEAAVCLCTAIKANVLGINLNVPLSLSLLLNACGNHVPSGYQCA